MIPYRIVDDLCQVAGGVDPARLEMRVFVASKNKAVAPADIRLVIQSAVRGPIPVPVGTSGELLQFPHGKELRRENPAIIANQPKGTLTLTLQGRIPVPEGLAFPYRRLGDGVDEANKMIRSQAGMLSLLAPKATGVVFVFPPADAGRAKVEIAAAAGRKEYTADSAGRVKLKLDKTLLAENPGVKVSQMPELVMPDLE